MHAHQLVLCSNSSYLADICDGGFKIYFLSLACDFANSGKDGVTQRMSLDEIPALQVKKMQEYLHTENYTIEGCEGWPNVNCAFFEYLPQFATDLCLEALDRYMLR